MSGKDSYGVDYCGLPWQSRLMLHSGNRIGDKDLKTVVCDAVKSSACVCVVVFFLPDSQLTPWLEA